jgi:hypothetical protein
MAAIAFVVTLEKDLPDPVPQAAYAKGKTGKALARESDRIDSAARRKKVSPLTALLSENPAALMAKLVEDGFDPAKMNVPPERWFTAAEGLVVVRALTEHVTANLNDFKQPNPILRDLKAVDALLAAAEAVGVRFHLTNVVL